MDIEQVLPNPELLEMAKVVQQQNERILEMNARLLETLIISPKCRITGQPEVKAPMKFD